ncbi:MAG: alpha/beta fold hydrolase [Anaerolineae bacterium]
MDLNGDLQINRATYEWSVRIFAILEKMLRVNLKLHHSKDQVSAGEIFLFNHFARFETFIPQYLIYREAGVFCRSVAASDFFMEGSALSSYLLKVGAVPNNHPRLLPFLAEEILRGRKVIVFPEGGMVKDHRVLDSRGQYSVYSPTARKSRKLHTGPAVLALALDAFKAAILRAYETGNRQRVEAWAEALRLDGEEALMAAARRPTLIVPANITFYPIRVSDNILRKVAELFSRGLSRGLSEELLIEGNILLKDTDMDIRLGEPVRPAEFWRWWERTLMGHLARKIDSLDGFFRLTPDGGGWDARLGARRMRRRALQIRDEYMHRMYTGVTVNLSHLTSRIILRFVEKGQMKVDRATFHNTLYLAVKNAQREPTVELHRSLKNPEAYSGVIDGQCPGLDQFMRATASMNLVERENGRYRFLSKLRAEHESDEVRLENLVAVYANEVAPISGVIRSVEQAIEKAPTLDNQTLARMRFDDELIAYDWDRQYFSGPRYEDVNGQETATESGKPFLLVPEEGRELGVVLVHGFLASPAEVRSFGEKLQALGYPVIGVRLKGHATSPWDLRERSWQDWLEPVRRGYSVMSAFASRICLVGFSAGGALSLRLAADCPERLVGVAAISVPLRFRDRNMIFVPLVHGANRLVRWVSSFEEMMPFRPKDSEHPHINYRNVPIRGLYELRRMVDELEERLPDVECPVTLIQGTDDPIVEPKSAELIHKRLGTSKKHLVTVPATRHGILYEDIGDTQKTILSFLAALSSSDRPALSTARSVSQ